MGNYAMTGKYRKGDRGRAIQIVPQTREQREHGSVDDRYRARTHDHFAGSCTATALPSKRALISL